MQIANNTISAVQDFYRKELAHIYTESELQNVIRWVLQKQLTLTSIDPGMRINESDMVPLSKMCKELRSGRPIQYVLSGAEFFGLAFKVDESVLIPRPETEELVEMVIKDMKATGLSSVLDIGTGSGCIPVSIKKNIPPASVYALDISEEALETAKANATNNDVSVNFFKTDILQETAVTYIRKQCGDQLLDVIVSNPPYVPESEKESLHTRVRDFEPHTALFVADKDPILFYRKIAEAAQKLLKSGGKLWFECHADHASKVQQMLHNAGFESVKLHVDLSGSPRFTEAITV